MSACSSSLAVFSQLLAVTRLSSDLRDHDGSVLRVRQSPQYLHGLERIISMSYAACTLVNFSSPSCIDPIYLIFLIRHKPPKLLQ